MKKRIIAAVCLLLILPCLALPAAANSAQMYWSGIDSTGAIFIDGNCPVLVEHEALTFDLSEFPANYYFEEEDFLNYPGRVTAEYTFYNPSDMTVTATLAFPFGNLPGYAYDFNENDISKYDVTINGEAVEKNVRHTLTSYHSQFELESDLPLLCDDYVQDDFYYPEMTVTKYSWKISDDLNYESISRSATFSCDVEKADGKRTIYFPGQGCGHVQKDNDYRIGAGLSAHDPVLYVFGEPFDELPEWKIYKDAGCYDGDEIDSEITFYESETMTLLDFALANRDEESNVSTVDWYNALIAELKGSVKHSYYPVVSLYAYERGYRTSLMRWYQYNITIEPRGHITNAVTAPMYPSIDMSYVPTVCEYTYLLSPASTWSEFGSLDIIINTPYYITESNIGGFTKTEEGYTLTLDGLPTDEDGKVKELIFSLSTEENPTPRSRTPDGIKKNITYFLAFCGPIILIGAILITVIIIIINRRKR